MNFPIATSISSGEVFLLAQQALDVSPRASNHLARGVVGAGFGQLQNRAVQQARATFWPNFRQNKAIILQSVREVWHVHTNLPTEIETSVKCDFVARGETGSLEEPPQAFF